MTREEIWNNIEKLSALRSEYNIFDEIQKPFYQALSLGIKGIKLLEMLDDIKLDLWMEGVNMTGEYQGVWVRFKDIERIFDKHLKEYEDAE